MAEFNDVRKKSGRGIRCKACSRVLGPDDPRGSLVVALSEVNTTSDNGQTVAAVRRRFCESCAVDLFMALDEIVNRWSEGERS